MTPEPSRTGLAQIGLELHHAGHHLAATCSTDPIGRLAAGTLLTPGPSTVTRGERRNRLGRHRDAAADAGGDHRDGQRAGAKAFVRERFRGRHGDHRRHGHRPVGS